MLKMDVRDDDSVRQAVKGDNFKRREDYWFGFNNAGTGISGPLEETNLEEYKELFESNAILSMVRVVKEVLPHMRRGQVKV